MCLEQARLEVDYVVAELVVLGLEILVQFAQMLEFLDLILELLDVLLFALTKRTLPRLAKSGTSATTNILERLGSVPRAC